MIPKQRFTIRMFLLILILILIAVGNQAYSYHMRLNNEWDGFNCQIKYLALNQKYAESLLMSKKVSKIAENPFFWNRPKLIRSLNNLAAAYVRLHEYYKAESICQRAINLGKKYLKTKDPIVAITCLVYGDICYYKGEYDKAERFYIKGLEIWQNNYGPNDKNTSWYRDALNRLHKDKSQKNR